jgi:hypothetical protein
MEFGMRARDTNKADHCSFFRGCMPDLPHHSDQHLLVAEMWIEAELDSAHSPFGRNGNEISESLTKSVDDIAEF